MMPTVSRALLLSSLFFVGCLRAADTGPRVDSLVGLTVPLASSPAMRVVMHGTVHGEPASVTLDPSQPISFATSACLSGAEPIARVTVPDAFGPDEAYPVAKLVGLSLGGARLRPFNVAHAEGDDCIVVLGGPELADTAIEVNPALRTVRFRASQSRAKWEQEVSDTGDDAQVLTLTREPRTDWPLMTLRLRQGQATFDATVLLSLREPRSLLYEAPARAAGLKPGLELLSGLPLPNGVELPPELSQLKGFAFDSLELARGFGLTDGSVNVEAGAPPHTPQGVLGADVWGRFITVWDVPEGVLVLRRPRVFTSGTQSRCARDGVTSAEACFELHLSHGGGEVGVIATVWSPLSQGAQLSFDLTGGSGTCRVGVTFGPGDRGRSTQHRFPWQKLRESVPGCSDEAFTGVTNVEPGHLEDSPLPECSGTCGFARDAVSGRLSCECQPGVRTADGEAEKRLLELFRRALEKLQAPVETEPADPD